MNWFRSIPTYEGMRNALCSANKKLGKHDNYHHYHLLEGVAIVVSVNWTYLPILEKLILTFNVGSNNTKSQFLKSSKHSKVRPIFELYWFLLMMVYIKETLCNEYRKCPANQKQLLIATERLNNWFDNDTPF